MSDTINAVVGMVAIFLTYFWIESLELIENTNQFTIFLLGCLAGLIFGIILSVLNDRKKQD